MVSITKCRPQASVVFLPVLSRGRGPGELRELKLPCCLHSLCRMDKPAKAPVIMSQARGFNIEPLSVWRRPVSTWGGGS